MDLIKYLNKNSILEEKFFEVLIVDDNIPFAKYLEELLRRKYKNYKISIINNPIDAIKRLSTSRVDLLILDINMPNMNGLECAEKFNKFFNFKIPILFVSANKNAETMISSYNLSNFYFFLPKPINEAMLFDSLSKLLRIKQV